MTEQFWKRLSDGVPIGSPVSLVNYPLLDGNGHSTNEPILL